MQTGEYTSASNNKSGIHHLKEKLFGILHNDATFLFISTIIVNAGNYAINLVLGRVLGPAEFAEASIITTGVLMLSFMAVGLQLTAAKYSAGYFAEQNAEKLSSFSFWIYKKGRVLGLVLLALILMSAQVLMKFFHFDSSWPFIIVAIGIPGYLMMSAARGWMQGTDHFKPLAFTYIIEMVARLLLTFLCIFLVYRLGLDRTTEAVSIGFLGAFVLSYLYAHKKIQFGTPSAFHSDKLSGLRSFIVVIIIYEFSQILINNSDILLVKHYFNNVDAGIYAALALIGRVVFFATWTIVTLLFPKVIQLEKQGKDHSHLFWSSLGIVVGIGLIIIAGCYLFDQLIITILFGDAYLDAAPLLWKYASATTLFASANVFVYYYMSLDRYVPVALSVIAGITQIFSILFFHQSMQMVIYVQILVMACLLVSMMIYHLSVLHRSTAAKLTD